MDRQRGILFGVQLLSILAALAFGATAFLSVLDTAGRYHPLHGFLHGIGLALAALAIGFLAGYLAKKDKP